MTKKPRDRISRRSVCAMSVGTLAILTVSPFSGAGPLEHLFQSKDHYTGPVAKRVAEFNESFPVGGLAFSADGAQLATNALVAGLDTDIWDWSGKSHIVRVLHKTAPSGSGDAIRYSPDGMLLAVGHQIDTREAGFGIVRIWNTSTGKIVHDIGEPRGAGGFMGLAFSPDGKWFYRTVDIGRSNIDGFVVHRTDTWEQVWGLLTRPFFPRTLTVSPDGQFVAIAGATGNFGPPITWYPKILVVDLQARKVIRTIEQAFPEHNQIHALAWSPDGKHLAAGGIVQGSFPGPDAVRLFDPTTATLIGTEQGEPSFVTGLVYTPDGRYLIEGHIDRAVRIWDGSHTNLLQRIPVDFHSHTILAVSPDSRYFSIAEGERVSVWELQ
jgi:WD40 repeat protein